MLVLLAVSPCKCIDNELYDCILVDYGMVRVIKLDGKKPSDILGEIKRFPFLLGTSM